MKRIVPVTRVEAKFIRSSRPVRLTVYPPRFRLVKNARAWLIAMKTAKALKPGAINPGHNHNRDQVDHTTYHGSAGMGREMV